MIEFYGAVLGLERKPKPGPGRRTGAWFSIGAQEIHLSPDAVMKSELEHQFRHVCLRVDDLAAMAEKLEAAGAILEGDPRPEPGIERFFARDPAGNLLEFQLAL